MSFISRLFQAPVNYVEHKVDEVRGEVRAELANGLASASIYLLFGTAALLAIIFISISLAIGIALWTGIYYLGFLILGFVYSIVAYLVWRLSRNTEYMTTLRNRFHTILKVHAPEPVEDDFNAYENDL